MDNSNGILYIGLKKYDRHLSHLAGMQPSSIPNAFAAMQKERIANASKRHNRCFNCWTAGCSVRSCRKPRDNAPIKPNLEEYKKMKGSSGRPIHYADQASAAINIEEVHNTFVAAVTIGGDKPVEVIDAHLEPEEDEVENIHFNAMNLHSQGPSLNEVATVNREVVPTFHWS